MSKQKNKSGYFWIWLYIYPMTLHVSINQTDKQLKKAMKKAGRLPKKDQREILGDTGTHHAAYVTKTKSGRLLLRLYKVPCTPTERGNLAHEIFHAVEFIADWVALEHTPNNMAASESWAYLTSFITEEIYKRIKRL